eukprot:CAMPEP_0116876400 /NCGR_PEP_ID=MMETSP0463-20121206/8345_1 /TAXON_ID=181622 /ORGANISM="Strombidinopsis sp, Strain SopsisLIS2011" /LENGTH=250 /DNA_ID=CAMNT_0004522973 /DNA_START=369 /DNA_END=1121 /DNA_ORIENTATION=+
MGEVLEKETASSGVHANFSKDDETPTGTCAVVVVGKERSLCANIAAAAKYPTKHLEDSMAYLEKATFIYSTSFFITSNFEALIKIGKYCAENNKPFGYNLSAVFLLQFFKDQLMEALSYSDYTFANEDEADAFAKAMDQEGADRTKVAEMIVKSPKVNSKRNRVAVITQGPLPVIVARLDDKGEVEIKNYEVPALEDEKIVDTNGAGDAFVGAFLAKLLEEASFDECVDAGIKLSGMIVQRSGATFPETA